MCAGHTDRPGPGRGRAYLRGLAALCTGWYAPLTRLAGDVSAASSLCPGEDGCSVVSGGAYCCCWDIDAVATVTHADTGRASLNYTCACFQTIWGWQLCLSVALPTRYGGLCQNQRQAARRSVPACILGGGQTGASPAAESPWRHRMSVYIEANHDNENERDVDGDLEGVD
jgi:hypothetical protein